MGTITFGEICDAVHDAMEELVTSGDLGLVENYNELREGKNTKRSVQIYPERGEFDSVSQTDRTALVDPVTGQPGVRQSDVTIFIDLYVRQRSQLNEDWGEAVDLHNAVYNKIEEKGGACPVFGLDGLRSFRCVWDRVVHEYATILYTGFRYQLTFRIF